MKRPVTKTEIPTPADELNALFKEIDNRYKRKKRPTEKEILEEIQAYRHWKRAKQGT